MATILWHDYETSGTDPKRDRPLQFAALQTTEDLREVGEPVVIRARLGEDALPDPEACLVTGYVPGDRSDEEVSELEFARAVAATLAPPDKCVAGFNSIRFDDEFTRFLFWRCLMPVYDREWRRGNSRWDLIDAMRAAYAWRPDGIEWPRHENGKPSFRLEDLARANDIAADGAHDALVDVRTTIALARLLRDRQRKLFGWLYRNRTKKATRKRLPSFADAVPIAHVSSKFAAEFACSSVVVPVTERPGAPSQVVTVDLRHDPEVLLDETGERLRELLYTSRDALPEDAPRVGLKTIHMNRAPVFAPLEVLEGPGWERIGLEPSVVEERAAWVRARREELAPVLQALAEYDGDGDPDPELRLYGGFAPREDDATLDEVHATSPASWRALEGRFSDERLPELLFRLRAREAPETLTEDERERWREHVQLRLATPLDAPLSRIDAILEMIPALRIEKADEPGAADILDRVERLVRARAAALGAAE